MSYHILHITDYGCKLYKERGLLVCEKNGAILGKIAIEDLRAVVLLNEAVSISGTLVAEIAGKDAVIIHCKNFKPVGITVPNIRTYDAKVVLNQAAGNKNLNLAIWRRLLLAKVGNQSACLKSIGVKNARLPAILSNRGANLNEALCAREYWKHFFPAIGEYGKRREPADRSSKANVFLNYGYGILGGILHRGIIVSGLNCLLGVNHKTYYKNTPLVYDLIEPFRAFVDLALYRYFISRERRDLRSWAAEIGTFLKNTRVKKGLGSVKLLDAADLVCESLANVYRHKKADNLWLPELTP